MRLRGGDAAVMDAIVGSTSIMVQSSPHVVPAGIFPGQRMMQGILIPPSLVA
jgi:hypothetical protein